MVWRQRRDSCAKRLSVLQVGPGRGRAGLARWFGGLLFFVALPALAQNPAVRVDINVGAGRHAISPLIYGVAFAQQSELDELNAPLHRNGGNASSRYNWQLNASNRANDWYFESQPYSSPEPGGEVDAFIASTRTVGAEPMITVPMVGWVARLDSNRSRTCSYSISKYGPQTDRDWAWYPDAGNGTLPDGRFVTNDPNDANMSADPLFQKGWVLHLLQRWGTASSGGVRYYLMDNEPSLWHSTHRDVHPTGATMDEVRDKHLAYAAMVKDTDPGALVFGPEEWGWSGYLYSGYDHQYAPQTGYTRFPDRENHGGWYYVPWLLDQFRQNEQATGRRLLDVLSVHYYPQGGEFSSDTSTSMQQRRNRSTRSLWDPNYIDESWIQDKVMLVPRLKNWVGTYYPGLKVGVTEYNWGAEAHINGATAQADILGIFGREGLDYGVRWESPNSSTPTYKAMKMYRNYDGLKSTFGDVSVSCVVPNPDDLSAFAAQRTGDGALTVMVVSKVLSGETPITLNLTGFAHAGVARRWQLTAANTINRLADVTVSGSGVSSTVPAQSITLFVIPAGGTTSNQPPVAQATATPSSGTAPLVVGFSGTGSTDPEGHLVAYAWNFGDGQQGTGPTVSHTYSQPGTYTATLTVTDDGGATSSATVTVSVLSAPPSDSLAAPVNFYAQASGTDVTLRWTDNSQGEEGFIIERSPETWPFDFQEVGRVGPNVTTFVNRQVPQGSYFYRARAYQGTVFSGYSNMDGARVQ
ncbi:glycoside hydrolase family 44 protein [Vitiosangium sp. GDMCC 1.1324]|uniref:glycoside hydrolase family 44 protein n=1 Tax=Vitiosangium sp. (strain GDMCC 1.1324) TaxID=2138576 RepID=UPI000D337D95|nr:glycoside hydrolase family 44 protein [Vitiosangium sp. GDMCC 1.1324]PTL81493.1 cellulase [Vitiosangium sp. GDMCC 1.1324]